MERKQDQECCSAEVDDKSSMDDQSQKLLQTLEQASWDGLPLVKYCGCWVPAITFRTVLAAQTHFKAKDTDIILSTMPKSGTTWLKALTYSIANRNAFPIDQSPLLTSTPHMLVPFLDLNVYWEQDNPHLENIPSPRIFSTHMHFKMLPDSIHETDCRIIHICRNPLDQFVSHINFSSKTILEKNPGKVLFLKYEDLKEDITSQVKKIAEFIGFPFSVEEEEEGLIDHISGLCSFETLCNLAVKRQVISIVLRRIVPSSGRDKLETGPII
ncbi:UNVERIFIED_CONTAM: Cytosolic sulfotransferase 15 [Sesamum latifolium]|uniref:Sulfotransferase n=1 Tax=Sesamum latifolium TaxID=2727402 RepID=A0AAW2TNG2_9LAMI